MKKIKVIIFTLIIIGVLGGIAAMFVNLKLDNTQESIQNEQDSIDKDENNNYLDEDIDNIDNSNNSINNQNDNEDSNTELENKVITGQVFSQKDNYNVVNKGKPGAINKPSIIEKPVKPELPSEDIKPSEPENPDEEKVEDLIVTKEMIKNGVYKIANKKYKTITIDSGIKENVKLVLENIEIQNDLILIDPSKYQLDIINTSMSSMLVMDSPIQFFSMAFKVLEKVNKSLDGATVNFQDGSSIDSIIINSNIEINGENQVPNINVNNTSEVVLNIPSDNLSLNTNGVIIVNAETRVLENLKDGAKININAPVASLKNMKSSTIRVSEGNVIKSFHNLGENTTVSGNGTINNTKIEANNTRIYLEVSNGVEASESIDYLIRKEEQIKILDVVSKTQGSVVFTLSEAVDLTLKDISVICTAGKNISLFNLYTEDNKTYTLTTNYFKNDSYGLYITLPNGNIISKDFGTDYANPTVTDVVIERVSDKKATLKLYGVDEGGYLYYILEESNTRKVPDISDIKQNGKSESVKVGFNGIAIEGLEAEKSYNLYYAIEGFFDNISEIKGPFEVASQINEENPSKYSIVYAKEEVSNHFVFKLNRIPAKELTLDDFEIHCPSDSGLTIKDAKFFVSPDLLTYIIDIPSNYGHKDNEYTVKIQVSENEVIEKDFVTHMNPPVITGAVDGVVRNSLNSAQFTFNSDESGEVYYGIYEWNGGIYDYNSTTPFASDVITGKIKSNKQRLNTGANTIDIDLSNVEVTKYTRIWALFIDDVGNYRVGFVDHYKIPEFVEQVPPTTDSILKITSFKYTNNTIEIEFNEDVLYNIISDDIELSVVETGSLPNKLLYIINNDIPKKVSIKIQNYTLPTGIYQLTINATDKNEKNVKLVERIEIN